MRFNNPDALKQELTFSDVFLFQQLSDIISRTEVNTTPNSPLSTTIPIISSNMNSVTGKRMAQKLARLGGLGVLPQDMDLQKMLKVIDYIHRSDIRLDEPLTVIGNDTIRDALGIINKKSHQAVVMVDLENKPIAVFKESDLEGIEDEHTKLRDLKTRQLITGERGISDEEAFNIMEDNNISSLPIVEKGVLVGILTKNDSVRNSIYTPSLNSAGELDVAVALSLNGYKNRIDDIINAGVNTIFLDTAHGYTNRMIDAIKDIRDRYNDIIIISGNVMGGDGVEELLKAGANGVKVGIGPGAMCTTRMMTGVGRPQVSAVMESAAAAKENGGFIIADGGIKDPRDLSIALALGATHAMFGTVFAGTNESPGDIIEENGEKYKKNWGMASGKAVTGRTEELSSFEQAKRERFKEGISKGRIYNPKPLGDVVDKYITGLVSAMTYTGARDLKDFYRKAKLGVQTSAGFYEGKPHGEIVKK